MQHPSTLAGPRPTSQNTSRAPRPISPINAAQRAGYMLDAEPPNHTVRPEASGAGAAAQTSAPTQAH